MRALIQRVKKASVRVEGEKVGEIAEGLVILLGVGKGDSTGDAEYLAKKSAVLRIFNDSEGKMNLSVLDIEGEALVVSQFTLYGDCRKGRRPSYVDAAPPDLAEDLYESFVRLLRAEGVKTQTGSFGASMDVELINWGPVTLILESPQENPQESPQESLNKKA